MSPPMTRAETTTRHWIAPTVWSKRWICLRCWDVRLPVQFEALLCPRGGAPIHGETQGLRAKA